MSKTAGQFPSENKILKGRAENRRFLYSVRRPAGLRMQETRPHAQKQTILTILVCYDVIKLISKAKPTPFTSESRLFELFIIRQWVEYITIL